MNALDAFLLFGLGWYIARFVIGGLAVIYYIDRPLPERMRLNNISVWRAGRAIALNTLWLAWVLALASKAGMFP